MLLPASRVDDSRTGLAPRRHGQGKWRGVFCAGADMDSGTAETPVAPDGGTGDSGKFFIISESGLGSTSCTIGDGWQRIPERPGAFPLPLAVTTPCTGFAVGRRALPLHPSSFSTFLRTHAISGAISAGAGGTISIFESYR